MKWWKHIQNYMHLEANQSKVNRVLCNLLFLLLLWGLIENAWYNLPERPLDFFTSDSFEFSFTALIALLVFYYIKPKTSLIYKIGLVFLFLSSFAGLAFLKAYRRSLVHYDYVFSEFSSYVVLCFLFISLFYFFKNLHLLVNNSYERTKAALKETELRLLRQQFNPHFLYNAFNSLYSMSLQNHPKTSDNILKLSGMMRYLTDEASIAGVLLRHELKFIRDYLDIEKTRFGEEADILFQTEGSVEDQLIEPLLLIVLVENAFKHGFYTNNAKAFVKIKAKIENKELVFEVRNRIFKKQHFQDSNRKGKGLENLKKRLKLSSINKQDLQISQEQDEYIAKLQLTLN